MSQFIKIGSTNYFNLRSAIRAATAGALTGQTIDIGDGFYDIRSSATSFTPTPDPLNLRNPNTFARFGAKTLTFSGSGSGNDPTIDTIITGNARIYAGQSDRGSGVPVSITLKTLRLSYGETFTVGASSYTSPNGSGYILQSGDKVYNTGGLSAINSRIGVVNLDGVTFAGRHSGAVGSGGGAPFGNYMDVAVSTSLTFDNINVSLTGQGGGSFFANNPTTYGSAFLLANGPSITVRNSFFDESGYRNALSLWGASGFETNVTITNNTFTRTTNQIIRTAGETLSRVKGSVTDNTFEAGAYLDLQNLNLPNAVPPDPSNALGIANNTFNLLQGGYGIVVRDGQTTANLKNLVIEGNAFNDGLAVVNEITTPNAVLSFGTNYVNGVSFDTLQVGGAGADTVIGLDVSKDWISGGDGADTLTGGTGADAFVFAKTGPADTITDFSGSGGEQDKIWLDNAAFTGLGTGALAAADFGAAAAIGTDVVYSGGSLYFKDGGSANLGDYALFATLTGTPTPTLSNTDFLVF